MTEQVLVVGPSWVGDMVMAQSMFKALKDSLDCQIDVLAPSWSGAILARMPEVRDFLVMSVGHGQLKLAKRWHIANQLRNKYDRAYVLPNSFKSALIPFWAGIPKRIGWLGEMRFGLLTEARRLSKSRYPKMVERFVALAHPNRVKDMSYGFTPPTLQASAKGVDAVKRKFMLDMTKPVLALFPGAEFGTAKRWPAKYYAQIAKQRATAGWAVWMLGSVKDMLIADEIQSLSDGSCIDLVGQTSLSEALDLISMIDVAVTNDSGLLHITSALQKPVIAIYGPTDPKFAPPLNEKAKILYSDKDCSPCKKRACPLKHNKCMLETTPNAVSLAIDNLMSS